MTIQKFEKNANGIDYVVGDIHGNYSKLQNHLTDIGFDESKDRLFCVGDLVDRGPESAECIDWLCKPWFYSVRGNHEEMFLDFCRGFKTQYEDDCYVSNGGSWAYSLSPSERLLIKDCFESLPLVIEIETSKGKIAICHAEYPFDKYSDQDTFSIGNQDYMQWSRFRIQSNDSSRVQGIDWVVVGHTPLIKPQTLGNHVFIDTKGYKHTKEYTILNIESLY